MSDDLLGGRYRLESVLGRGGMATVWRAVDTRLGRPVAVKVLETSALVDPATRERFNREAWTVARLRNAHVVAVFDADLEGDRRYLVMELVEGATLAALLAGGPLEVDRAVAIAMQVCDALTAAHAVGVVHRDVKPGNILVDAGGTVMVCDFGIARLAGASHSALTVVGTTIGTSRYMAPEQVSGGPVDARTDLYGLGCVLYAMLTGAPPFEGDAPLDIAWQQLHREPEPIRARRPDLPDPLADLIGRLLAKNPADRPRTAADVRAVLATVAADKNTSAAATAETIRGTAAVVSPTRTMPVLDEAREVYPPAGRLRWWPAAAAVGVAGVILVAVVLAMIAGRPDRNAGPSAGGTPVTTATSDAPSATPSAGPGSERSADPIDALREAVAAQAAAEQIDADAAEEIDAKLDDLAEARSDGKEGKATKKARDLVRTLADIRDDGKITDAGWAAVEPAVRRLTGGLPREDDD